VKNSCFSNGKKCVMIASKKESKDQKANDIGKV
jgi:hypothetical protein